MEHRDHDYKAHFAEAQKHFPEWKLYVQGGGV
jgi:hypothetical protein